MRDSRMLGRAAAAGLMALVMASCNAQDAPVAPSVDWPPPAAPQLTNLRGHVIDVVSGARVPAARIAAEDVVVFATEEGEYAIGNLRLGAILLIATKAGFDTTYSFIPLEGGDKEFVLRMRPTSAQPVH